jgi:hypothetical protein
LLATVVDSYFVISLSSSKLESNKSAAKRLKAEKESQADTHEKSDRSVPLVDSSGESASMLSKADRGPN